MNSSPWIIILAVLVYGFVHSLLAALPVKALARRLFGPAADRLYRIGYNIFAIFSFLPVLALIRILPDRPLYSIRLPWAMLTLAGQLAAAALLVVGVWQTGAWSFLGFRQLAGEVEEAELVVGGLYRWVRHPLYTAGLAFIWLTPVMTANLLALNVGLTAYIVLGALYEERKLVQIFGPAYLRYKQSTPMLIPGLRRNI